MSEAYLKHVAAHRRICILRLLRESPKNSANVSILHDGLSMLGLHEARDVVLADIRFLIENGLMTDQWYASVQVCQLTRRGADVAEGLIEIEGVKKPSNFS